MIVAGRGNSDGPAALAGTASRVAAAVDSTEAQPATDPAPAANTRRTGASGGGSSGRDHATKTVTPISAPRVTFGDGRSPGHRPAPSAEPPSAVNVGPSIVGPVPEATVEVPPLPAPPPPPVSAPLPTPTFVHPIEWSPETPVTSLWGRVQPGWPAGLVFGIAGLLLAPIGGIWLGQRQARATRTAEELVSS
jgi:hypothetical protein